MFVVDVTDEQISTFTGRNWENSKLECARERIEM